MGKTKFHIFFAWLIAIAVIFSNIPLQQIFAEGGGSGTPKDVSDRLVFSDKLSVYEKKDGKEIYIYEEGELKGSNQLEVRDRRTIRYVWEVPEANFNGVGFTDGKINSGDYFKIKLPSKLEFAAFDKYKWINESQHNYGTWRIENQTEGGKRVQYLHGIFGNAADDPSTSGFENGYFEIDFMAIEATDEHGINLNLNPRGTSKILKIIENTKFPAWDPSPFYKQGSANINEKNVSWSLITSFDNLKKAFDGTSIEKREDIIVWDAFPYGTDIQEIQLKIPVYVATPEPRVNGSNYDKNVYIEPGKPGHIPEGRLTWISFHEMNVIYKLGDNNSAIIRSTPGENFDAFKERVNRAQKNDSKGMPAVGIYEGKYYNEGTQKEAEGILVYVNLGSSPNEKMTYSDFYQKRKYRDKDTLEDYLTYLKDEGRISNKQFNVMKRVYLDGTHHGHILAWSVGIKVGVRDENDLHENDAWCKYKLEGPSGGEKSLKGNAKVYYQRNSSGVDIFKRLSFPVEKRWLDENGDALGSSDIPRENLLVDVYRVEGAKETKVDSATLKLTADKGWKGTVKGLPLVDKNNNPIQYTVKEESVAGFQSTVERVDSSNLSKGFVIKNKREKIEKPIQVTVQKSWADGSAQKPVAVYLQENRSGVWTDIDRAELNAPHWKHIFKNLDPHQEYGVREEMLYGYEAAISQPEVDGAGNITFTITNKQIGEETVDIHVTKEWRGENLDDITIKLLASTEDPDDDSKYCEVAERKIVSDPWTYTFKNYPKKMNGKEVHYKVREVANGDYNIKITTEESANPSLLKFKITNVLNESNEKSVPVKKVWKNADGTLMEESSITTDKITVELISVDGDTEKSAGMIELTQNNHWSGLFKNVSTRAENGNPLEYKIKEIGAPSGYTTIIRGDLYEGFVITNKKNDTPPPTPNSETTTRSTDPDDDEEEKTTKPSTTTTTTTTTVNAAVSTTTESTTEDEDEDESEETTERITTTEGTTDSPIPDTTSPETSSAPEIAVITTAPTAPATTRTFEFIEIFEDVPLGVKTTAPLDLELLLIEESVPLSGFPFTGLPYTHTIPAEILVGMGMLILTIGLTLGRRL